MASNTAAFSPSKIEQLQKDILLQDIANKKAFIARKDLKCNACGNPVWQGDTFYFIGLSMKVCALCKSEMEKMVENL